MMTTKAKKYAIIGHSIGYSLSPLIHNEAFKIRNINARYDILDIKPESFDAQIHLIKKGNYSGFNVTIPYKSKIIGHLDYIDPRAEFIGAVNTIEIKNDEWRGYNTDVSGFLAPLRSLSDTFSTCVILGNGGAARAVIYGLLEKITFKTIYICARNRERSAQLIEHLKDDRIKHFNLSDVQQLLPETDLLINTTPLGTSPGIDQTPVSDLNRLKKTTVLYDLVYNPPVTRLMRDASYISADIITIGGMQMLVSQAAHAFEIWTGEMFPFEQVYELLKKSLST